MTPDRPDDPVFEVVWRVAEVHAEGRVETDRRVQVVVNAAPYVRLLERIGPKLAVVLQTVLLLVDDADEQGRLVARGATAQRLAEVLGSSGEHGWHAQTVSQRLAELEHEGFLTRLQLHDGSRFRHSLVRVEHTDPGGGPIAAVSGQLPRRIAERAHRVPTPEMTTMPVRQSRAARHSEHWPQQTRDQPRPAGSRAQSHWHQETQNQPADPVENPASSQVSSDRRISARRDPADTDPDTTHAHEWMDAHPSQADADPAHTDATTSSGRWHAVVTTLRGWDVWDAEELVDRFGVALVEEKVLRAQQKRDVSRPGAWVRRALESTEAGTRGQRRAAPRASAGPSPPPGGATATAAEAGPPPADRESALLDRFRGLDGDTRARLWREALARGAGLPFARRVPEAAAASDTGYDQVDRRTLLLLLALVDEQVSG